MNDPHVESLHYMLETLETMQFNNPPPLDGYEPDFKYRLEDGKLTVMMKSHFPTEVAARNCVEPFLRSWELELAVRKSVREMTFKYERPTLVDRNPPKPGEGAIVALVGTARMKITCHPVTATMTYRNYPEPPTRFKASPDVETLWARYQMYKEGREPILSMANACLTLVEGSTHSNSSRKAAAVQYAIDFAVLDQIGKWAGTRGDATEARKLGASATLIPLTSKERGWLDRAVRVLIGRKAEFDAEPAAPLKLITMTDV